METEFDAERLPEGPVRSAFIYWQELVDRDPYPSRDKLDPTDIPELLPSICLVDVEHDPARFKVRLIGDKIKDGMGFNPTGSYVDEVAGTEDVFERFKSVVETGRGYWHDTRLRFGPKDYKRYSVVCLPLFDAERRVNMLLVAAHIYFDETRAYVQMTITSSSG